jgi:hypothetical protein
MRFALPVLAVAALLPALATPAAASSHREAPHITELPKVDGTDFYLFKSYEPGREGFVTLIANYLPLQDAYGGPNYFSLDPDARYRMHVDNDGDGLEDVGFEFAVRNTLRRIALPVGDRTVPIPLINAGAIGADAGEDALNVSESYTLKVYYGRFDERFPRAFSARDANTRSQRFRKPVDNIGFKSLPDYAAYAAQFVHDVDIPGCGEGRVFVGQRKESFAINLGEVFDLVNIANPIGAEDAEPSATEFKNITTFALEVPEACLSRGRTDVVGAWTTAALPRFRALRGDATFENPTFDTGDYVQVSRLGMPLVNEVVIGLPDKDRFNASAPKNDAQFATYVTNPTLPELLELLFGAAGVRAPDNFPRQDLVAAFVTGIPGLNELGFGEMQRLNLTIPPTPKEAQSRLGVIGGDNAGFPNGRRPGDDVTDIELRVAMGLLCHAFPGTFCEPADAPSGTLPFTDGALQDPSQFDETFPYLTTPVPGSPNGVNGLPSAAP